MARRIVIPIYDHTSSEEIAEILAALDTLGFANSPYVEGVPGYGQAQSGTRNFSPDDLEARAAFRSRIEQARL